MAGYAVCGLRVRCRQRFGGLEATRLRATYLVALRAGRRREWECILWDKWDASPEQTCGVAALWTTERTSRESHRTSGKWCASPELSRLHSRWPTPERGH